MGNEWMCLICVVKSCLYIYHVALLVYTGRMGSESGSALCMSVPVGFKILN